MKSMHHKTAHGHMKKAEHHHEKAAHHHAKAKEAMEHVKHESPKMMMKKKMHKMHEKK